MTLTRLAGFGLVLVSVLCAQSPNAGSISASHSFTAPILGMVETPDGSSAVPILGVPGAARFGDPLVLPATVTRIYVSPGSKFALVEQNSGASIGVAQLAAGGSSTTLSIASIPGAWTSTNSVTFSATGAAAALYSNESGEWEVITGLPSHPQAGGRFSMTGIPDAIVTSAISDDGQTLLTADAAGTLWSTTPSQSAKAVYRGVDISGVVILPYSQQAVVCDRGANAVLLLSGTGTSQPRKLLSADQGLTSPSFAAVTPDGSTILIASSSQQTVWSVELASGAAAPHEVPCQPAALKPLTQDRFLISSSKAPSTWIFGWNGGKPNAFFVAQSKHLASAQ